MRQLERLSSGAFVPPWVRREHEARYAFAASHLKDRTVVDCACGDGSGAKVFLGAGARSVAGFDISEAAVASARERCPFPNARFETGDGTCLPLTGDSADAYVSLESIEHVDDDRALLHEAARVLKPGGVFICSTPNRRITNPGALISDKPWNRFHVREYSREEFLGLLGSAFEEVELYGQNPQHPVKARLLESLAATLPKHGAVRVNQLLKLPQFFSEESIDASVVPAGQCLEYEYFVAVCRKPRKHAPVKTSSAAVILVNYRDYAQKHLTECYESLRRQDFEPDRMRVFIVDNDSTLHTRTAIKALAPEARLLLNEKNMGWAGGNNTAAGAALAEGFDHLVFLNMDMRVEPDWLRRLVEEAERRPDTHILQSKILLHGTGRVNSIGNRIHFLGFGYCNGYGKKDPALAPMDFASGAAMLVKRKVFEAVGPFREDYFMYGEDLEFSWRARLAGFNVGLAERSVCHHKHDAAGILQFLYHVERNRLCTLLTLAKKRSLLVILPCLLLNQIVLAVYFRLKGPAGIHRKLWKFFSDKNNRKLLAARRRQARALRKRPDRAIFRNFSGGTFVTDAHPTARRALTFLLNPLLRSYWALARLVIWW